MKAMGRRFFARQAAVAPLAADMMLSSKAAGGQLWSDGIDGGPISASNASSSLYGKANKLLRGARVAAQSRERRHQVLNGLDPDILALRSISPSYKARMLAERREQMNREDESLWAWARRSVGLPEEK